MGGSKLANLRWCITGEHYAKIHFDDNDNDNVAVSSAHHENDDDNGENNDENGEKDEKADENENYEKVTMRQTSLLPWSVEWQPLMRSNNN